MEVSIKGNVCVTGSQICMSNVSSWLDLEQVGHTWTKAGKEIKSTQTRKMGVGNLSVRFTEEIDIWMVT